MKKPDFSKEGMKKFFLYHSEKLILGVSLGLMGLFFWLGFSGKPFKDKTPSDLVGLADQAQQYIVNETSWEQIRGADARQGELDLVNRIQVGNQAVEVSNYPFGFWSIRAKTPATRKDPQLLPPKDLVATHVVQPVIFSPRRLRANAPVDDPLADLELAEAPSSLSGERGGALGGRADGRGRGGRDPSGRGGRDGRGDFGSDPGPDEEEEAREDAVVIDAGTSVLAVHDKTMPGIRPSRWQISTQSEQVLLGDVVIVTGLIDAKQLKANYLESFSDAIGYLPSRDKPRFKFLEVQRAEISAGEEPVWKDISEQIERTELATPGSLTLMPEAEYQSAPESIDPYSYDPILSKPIPAFTQFDYRSLTIHPKLKPRSVDPIAEEVKRATITDLASTNPDDEEQDTDEDKIPVRLGSDTSKYREALASKELKSDYKLVRFFDLSKKETGKTYAYRARVWFSDPNSVATGEEDSMSGSDRGGRPGSGRPGTDPGMGDGGSQGSLGGNFGPGQNRGGGSRGEPGMGDGGGRMGGLLGGSGRGGIMGQGRGGPAPGQDRGGGGIAGQGRGGPGRGDGGTDEENEDAGYENTPLTPQMKTPEVRARLAGASQKIDPKDKSKYIYFVSEPGYSEPVQVPTGKDQLRFCRPSPWSAPVEIKIIEQPRGDILAGGIESPRAIKIGSKELADGEPVADLVVAPWDKFFRAMFPGRKKSYRGESLDFAANIHVLNPISWVVHRMENAPIFSQTVLVDMMGGDELALPRDELMRHRTAAEVLVMQPDGSLKVTNDLATRTKFKQALFQPDDSNEVGELREKKPEPESNQGDRGLGMPGGRR
jgi:hypothetical protein